MRKNKAIYKYKCGLRAGDKIKLIKDMVIKDHKDKPTGTVYPKGEIWEVLPDCCSAWHDLWLRQANGKLHTWSDDESIFDYFRKQNKNKNRAKRQN